MYDISAPVAWLAGGEVAEKSLLASLGRPECRLVELACSEGEGRPDWSLAVDPGLEAGWDDEEG